MDVVYSVNEERRDAYPKTWPDTYFSAYYEMGIEIIEVNIYFYQLPWTSIVHWAVWARDYIAVNACFPYKKQYLIQYMYMYMQPVIVSLGHISAVVVTTITTTAEDLLQFSHVIKEWFDPAGIRIPSFERIEFSARL